MSKQDSWIVVDRAGLRQQMEGRSKRFIIFDLVQNVWDEAKSGATECKIEFHKAGQRMFELTVEDNSPVGMRSLAECYTIFTPSYKKNDPELRGCMGAGEKFVLAFAKNAVVTSTSGSVFFMENGTRTTGRKKRDVGTLVSFTLGWMNKGDYDDILEAVKLLLPPKGIVTTFNGEVVEPREPFRVAEKVALKTVIGEDLRSSVRQTDIHLHKVKDGEKAHIYEMGIPVMETGDQFHYDVQQKIPHQTWLRDVVRLQYLRKVRTAALNAASEEIKTSEEANQDWARQAVSDPDCYKEAVEKCLDLRFTKKRVAFDPSDIEANSRAVAEGYRVIHGSQLREKEWANVRRDELAKPAGQVLPTPKPYSDDPNAEEEEIVLESKWTDPVRYAVRHAKMIGDTLLSINVTVKVVNWGSSVAHRACFGSGMLTMDIRRCFKGITDIPTWQFHDLLIHEFAHHIGSDHLSDKYHKGCTMLGAKLTELALNFPELFTPEHFTRKVS